jgi:hypothetical protein
MAAGALVHGGLRRIRARFRFLAHVNTAQPILSQRRLQQPAQALVWIDTGLRLKPDDKGGYRFHLILSRRDAFAHTIDPPTRLSKRNTMQYPNENGSRSIVVCFR